MEEEGGEIIHVNGGGYVVLLAKYIIYCTAAKKVFPSHGKVTAVSELKVTINAKSSGWGTRDDKEVKAVESGSRWLGCVVKFHLRMSKVLEKAL